MAQLIVRNLDNSTKTRLQHRAQRNGRSMEEEVRELLRNAVHDAQDRAGGLGSEIARLFENNGLERDIPELTGHLIKPPTF